VKGASPAARRTFRSGLFARLAYHVVRLALGAIFVYASIDKIRHPAAFAEAIANYRILPDALVNPTAVILPWLEVVIGALLMGGVWMPGAAVLATVLLTVFEGAFIFNIVRGLNVYCGCFASTGEVLHGNAWYLARDSLFLAAALYLLVTIFRSTGNDADHGAAP